MIKRKLREKYNFISDSLTLLQWVQKYKYTILVDDAGFGKTSELNSLAIELKQDTEKHGLIPVLLDCKKFYDNTTFQDFIKYSLWNNVNDIMLIFDGLDETKYYNRLISELNDFCNTNSQKNIRYIISCRTFFFENFIKNKLNNSFILEFENITHYEIKEFLTKEGIDISKLDLNYSIEPFYLGMIIYLFKNGSPSSLDSKIDIFKNLIRFLIKKDLSKFDQILIGIYEEDVNNFLKNISYYIESNFKSKFNNKDILDCNRKNGIKIVNNSSFFSKIEDSTWIVKNKQFQEFFAAMKMADMELEDLYKVIFIKGTNKVRIHLFNTIGFLLNLIAEDKKQTFYDKIEENNPELFFNIESSHLDETVRDRVFKSLFTKIVEENGLWLAYAIGVDESKIGNFSKTKGNFDFLIEKLNSANKDISILNSIQILKYHDFYINNSVIEVLLEEQCKKDSKNIISAIIDLVNIKEIEISTHHINLIIKINDTRINTNLLLYLGSQSDEIINENFYFIENECKYYYGEIYREDVRNYLNFHWALLSICCKLNQENILKVSRLFFNHDLTSSMADKPFFTKYMEKLVDYINIEEQFLYTLLDMYIQNRLCELEYFYNSGFNEILFKSNKVIESIDYFEKKYLDKPELYYDLLIKLINEETKNKIFNLILKTKNDELIKNNFSLHFTRFIEEKYVNDYYTFLEMNGVKDYFRIKSQQDFEKEKEALLKEYQSDFDKISDESKFRELLSQFILEYNITEVDRDILHNLMEKHNYYELKNNVIYNYLDFLVKNDVAINLEDYPEILFNHSNLFKFIYIQVRDSNEKLDSSSHLNFLKEHTAHIVKEKKFLDFKSNESNNYFKAFLYFLTKKIVSITDTSYRLNLIKYAENGENGISLFSFILKEKDFDAKSFENKVLDNLKENDLFVSVKIEHIEYCLENRLTKSYELIKEVLLKNDHFVASKLLSNYYKVTKDQTILESFLRFENERQNLSIQIIIENQVKELYQDVISICLKKTETNVENIDLFSINCLFRLNHEKALSKFLYVLTNYPKPENLYWYDIQNSFEKFNNEKEIELLIDFFELDFGKFHFFPILYLISQYLANIIEVDIEKYETIKNDLEKIRNAIKGSSYKLFQISNVINEFEKKYLEILS